ncbi:tRNA pseudouridine(55) synthase TruB, partial [Escherichia coli]|uniref:tRNA pseudouridine(55) synthase TruB n=1 Tax=Escherichia coli TaxID=562 RepID=UPI003FA599C9
NMMTLEEFEAIAEQGYDALDAHLITMDTAVEHFAKVELPESDTVNMMFGRTIPSPVSLEHEAVVRMYDQGTQRFLGLGQIKGAFIRPYRLVNTSEFSL